MSESPTPLLAEPPPLPLSLPRARAAGGWVFRQRTWLPVPFALALVLLRLAEVEAEWPLLAGPSLVLLGQGVRLWAVRHIGVISRTRALRLGPLVATGPYTLTRNPLYVGNALMWSGFVIWSELVWMLPVAWALFALQYGAITQWEEHRLADSFGDQYLAYARVTPRWIPRLRGLPAAWDQPASHAWRDVLFSERGTLITLAVMSTLLLLKAWLGS